MNAILIKGAPATTLADLTSRYSSGIRDFNWHPSGSESLQWDYTLVYRHRWEGSRDLKEPLINNVNSDQDIVNNVIISTDRFIVRQILLDNVSADMKMCFT